MKYIKLLLVLLLLTACSSQNNTDNTSESKTDISNNQTLIAYFTWNENVEGVDASTSASIDNSAGIGNAAYIAGFVESITKGDKISIISKTKYPDIYDETTKQAKDEQNQEFYPELETKLENIQDYQTVILVYPIWWGELPQAMKVLLKSYDFKDKTILPIATHLGSQMGDTESSIKELTNADVQEGLAISGSDMDSTEEEVKTYLEKFGY